MESVETNVVALKSDADRAKEIREALAPALAAICATFDLARTYGLKADFQIALDPFGRHVIQSLTVVKPL